MRNVTLIGPLTRQDLRTVALRARTLDERLADASRSRADAFGERALERWSRAAGGAEKLRRRLAADGYDEEDARRALGSPVEPTDDLPPWAERLGEVLADADEGRHPVDLFLGDAVRRLGPREALTAAALAPLEARLRRNLAALAEPARQAAGDDARPVDFFREYSVLGRRLVRLCDTWIDSTRELDRRLAADRDLLAEQFGVGGATTGLRAGLSDRHHGGRQVCELFFERGGSVIYKPRSLGGEAVFQELLEVLAPELEETTPPRLRVYPRDGYGWMETAVHAPLTDEEQARLVFRRAGALLFAAWLIGADDLHTGNVVATADGPVIVDLETVLQEGPARAVGADGSTAGALLRARRRIADSFLGTGLLSFHRQDGEGRFFEIGGLLGVGEHNRFALRGEDLRPEDFHEEIVEGFTKAYGAARRAEPPRNLVERLRNLRPRRVLRSSQGYAHLLGRLASLESLRDGFTAGLALEFLDDRPEGITAETVRAEKASLQDLDVPAFRVDGRRGAEAMLERRRGLGEDDLRQQQEILRAALGSKGSAGPDHRFRADGADELETALGFARRLRNAAIFGDDGAATWLTPGAVRIAGRRERGMSYHLYDGGVGIAVFLAALARVTEDGRWADLARAALVPIEAVLRSPRRDELVRRENIGACSGLGSVVYGTTLVSRLLDDEGILDTARRTARMIDPERIAADDRFDVEGGAAGAVLGLRALYRADPEPWIRRRMILCAEHLADRLEAASSKEMPRVPAGFAHGLSGMAYALLASAKVDDRPRPRAAARQALLRERRFYDEGRKNWLALDGTARNAWCHGAPGIAVARFAAHGVVDEPCLEQELRTALSTTLRGARVGRQVGKSTVENVCCGRFGRIDLLLEAGRRFDRPDLVEAARLAARQRLTASTDLAEQQGYGFFRGLSGIGYTLLRLRDTAEATGLPSVLAFETMEVKS